jgi:putative transport protein
MIAILRDNPLVLLFTVAAIGYVLGRLSIAGVRLGVAAVLFVGLAIGSIDPGLRLPEVVYLFGLVLFVYTVGLSSGQGFFAAFTRGGTAGFRDSLFAGGILVFSAALVAVVGRVLGLAPPTVAGIFSGSLTNTPALAGVLDYLKTLAPGAALDQALAQPVVGYSITYPMGVAGAILAINLAQRLWRTRDPLDTERRDHPGLSKIRLQNRTIRVTRPAASAGTIRELIAANRWSVVFGRIKRGERVGLAAADERLAPGDLVSVIGTLQNLDRVTAVLGEPSGVHLEYDRSEYDHRRMFVSNPEIVGRTLRDLTLPHRFGAIVTRVRRGDADFLPDGDTVLELGDRVRVLTSRAHMDEVGAFFGDSYRALSEIDVMSFSVGLSAGLVLGLVPIPLPGGLVLRLGAAGGPLIVALILGAVGRTGRLVWTIPYSANLTLRQIGLVLFLAGVGTGAGHAFAQTLIGGGGIVIFVAGTLVTALTALAALWAGRRILNLPEAVLFGMYAGIQTQPAVLGFATEQTRDDLPGLGYARVYPVAMIAKIVLAQILVRLGP